jgi:hypothetical protein
MTRRCAGDSSKMGHARTQLGRKMRFGSKSDSDDRAAHSLTFLAIVARFVTIIGGT